MQSYEPEHPKPYELIKFAGAKPLRQDVAGHEAVRDDTLTGQMELYLIVRTPTQVANGSFEIQETEQGKQIVALDTRVEQYSAKGGDKKQTVVLPGSSLKGMMRSLLETLSPCCVATLARRTSNDLPNELRRCTKTSSLCPACRLFGMIGAGKQNYLGQISVEDARLIDGQRVVVQTPLLWSAARGARHTLPRIYKNENDQVAGRKVYHHSLTAEGPDARMALKIGSTLLTTIHFENLLAAELGLLISALGFHPQHRFLPKIGAAKPVGMGSVETYINSVTLNGDIRQQGRMGGGATKLTEETLQPKIEEWTAAASQAGGLLNQDALVTVAEQLGLKNLKREAVEGLY